MFIWEKGLYLPSAMCHLDAIGPVERSVITHAHSDHIARHKISIVTHATSRLLKHRLGKVNTICLNYREKYELAHDHQLKLLPAGHVLGSAMAHITGPDSTLLYTGDFKLNPSLTCDAAELIQADDLIMECTFSRPIYEFPPHIKVRQYLLELIRNCLKNNRQPIVFSYSFGKTQEVTKILTDADIPVSLMSQCHAIAEIYKEFGVDLGKYSKYESTRFVGQSAEPVDQRGVIIAPPSYVRSEEIKQFPNKLTLMVSGWGILPNAKYRYRVDEVIPLSDHADYKQLLQAIDMVRPKRVHLVHGFVDEFVQDLKRRGIKAYPAKPKPPDPQLQLFPEPD